MCSHSVPSRTSSTVAGDDLPGRRKDDAVASTSTSSHHSATMSTAITASDGSTRFMTLPLVFRRNCTALANVLSTPAQPGPRRRRHAARRRWSSVRWRAPCTQTGSSAAHRERQAEALARHHQRRAEDSAARRPGCCSSSTSLHAERQADLGGQDLDLVAGHAARPGALAGSRTAASRDAERIGASAAHAAMPSSRDASSSRSAGQRKLTLQLRWAWPPRSALAAAA